MPHDVLAHHNGIINQQTHAERQRHQGQHVDREAKHVHEEEGANQGNWQGEAGDDGGAPRVEEQKHNQHREQRAFNQGAAHVIHRDANRARIVLNLLELHAGWQSFFHLGDGLFQAIDHFNRVLILRLLHREQKRALAAVERHILSLLRAIGHASNLRQSDRR